MGKTKNQHQRPRRTAPARPDRAAASSHGDTGLALYGLHTVAAALSNADRRCHRLLATRNALQRLSAMVPAQMLAQVPADEVSVADLDRRLGPDAVHQGVLLFAARLRPVALESILDAQLLVALDQITDPHNVGAILRSAAAFRLDGAIMTQRHCPPLEGALAKAASGALDAMPIIEATNLARALGELAQAGFTLVGLDGSAPHALETDCPPGAMVLVLGAEGKGLRRLTRERCDLLCRIASADGLESLNVSTAAAVAFYAARQAAAVGSKSAG